MSQTFSVLIVDDHPIVQLGLRMLLEDGEPYRVCGDAATVADARELTDALRPDLVILDLVLGGRDGTGLIEDLLDLHPATRVLVYSSQDPLLYAPRSLRAGASGYVSKSDGLERVRQALDLICRGELAVSADVQRKLVRDFAAGHPDAGSLRPELFSDRELQVLRLLGHGLDSRAIAGELHLSIKTVGTYRERLKIKLGIDSARELERTAEHFVESERPTS